MNKNLTISGFDRVDFVNNMGDNKPSFTIWFSGCTHMCEGCHNPQLLNKENGDKYSVEELILILDDHKKKFGLYTVVLLGGEPLQQNMHDLEILCKTLYLWGISTWVYTGYNLNEAIDNAIGVIRFIDYIKCGKFDITKQQEGFPSSSNQRLYKRIDDSGYMWEDITIK